MGSRTRYQIVPCPPKTCAWITNTWGAPSAVFRSKVLMMEAPVLGPFRAATWSLRSLPISVSARQAGWLPGGGDCDGGGGARGGAAFGRIGGVEGAPRLGNP